jgi:hypothetical protein
MRARNREINIFNMSLLDILTGMLGAFLFLMLGLLPYYSKVVKNKPEDVHQQAELNKDLEKQLEDLKKLVDQAKKGPLTPEEIQKLMDQLNTLQQQIAQLKDLNQKWQDYAGQLESEVAQTKQQLQTTAEERDKWKDRVRTDLIVTARWNSPDADVDLFLRAGDGAMFGPKKEKVLGTEIKGTSSESHRPGKPPSFYEALNVGVANGQEYLVLFRVTTGKSPADYSNISGWAVIDDSVANSWVAITLPAIDTSRVVPGKVYAWTKLGIDEKGSLTTQVPTGQLPNGVSLP